MLNSSHGTRTYMERLKMLQQLGGTRKSGPPAIQHAPDSPSPLSETRSAPSTQAPGAQTVAPKGQAPSPRSQGPTHSTLDELAEQLESELQLCDISLNQLIRGSKMAASTRGTSSSPALRASSASTQYAAASSRTQPLPALSPRKSAAAANKKIAVAPAPTDTSLVKRLVTATGQGCQAILAPDLSRQPIPGVCWTTRTSRGGTPRSSCTLLLKHAASTDLLVRLTAAEGASVPRRVLLSTAPKPSARFEVLGEVELAAGSARHLRHVFRLAPGTIAGRCLRLDLVGHQEECMAGRGAGGVRASASGLSGAPGTKGGLPAHRITNLLVTGRSIDSPGPATGEAGIVPLQAQARASDDAPSFFSCAGPATGPTSALSQRSRDEASVVGTPRAAARDHGKEPPRTPAAASGTEGGQEDDDSVLTGSPLPRAHQAAGRGTKFGGGVAQRVLAEELEGEDRGERRMQGAAEWGDPELLEEASALSAPGTAGAPNEQQAHDACLDRAWRHFETRAADVARGASALVRAGREVQDCTGLAWIAGAARGAAGFLFRQGGAGAAEAVAALLQLRAIKSTRPGCSTLLHFLAREAASASGAEPRTLVGQLGHCREAADVDPADLQAGVQALRDLLEEEVVAALHAADPCSRAHEEWRAFRSDASEALAELEASVAKALLAYRDACETIAGGASASAPPAPASFFPALLEFAGEADAALAECLAGASQAGSRGPGKASAASSAASLRQTVWASRGVVSSAASAARSGGASRGSRKRPASRDLSAPSASVSLEGGIGGPGDDGALGQTGSAVAALTGAASSGGPPHSAPGSATLSPHVAALLAESDRLLRFSLGGRGGETEEEERDCPTGRQAIDRDVMRSQAMGSIHATQPTSRPGDGTRPIDAGPSKEPGRTASPGHGRPGRPSPDISFLAPGYSLRGSCDEAASRDSARSTPPCHTYGGIAPSGSRTPNGHLATAAPEPLPGREAGAESRGLHPPAIPGSSPSEVHPCEPQDPEDPLPEPSALNNNRSGSEDIRRDPASSQRCEIGPHTGTHSPPPTRDLAPHGGRDTWQRSSAAALAGIDMARVSALLGAARQVAQRHAGGGGSGPGACPPAGAQSGSEVTLPGQLCAESSLPEVASAGAGQGSYEARGSVEAGHAQGGRATTDDTGRALSGALLRATMLRASLAAARASCGAGDAPPPDAAAARPRREPRASHDWRSLAALPPLAPVSDLGVAAALASAGNSPSGPLVRGLRAGAFAARLPSGLAPPPCCRGGGDDAAGGDAPLRLLEPIMPAPLGLGARTGLARSLDAWPRSLLPPRAQVEGA
ncbi:hypothetical protein ACKKBF_B16215 [Auxenochlorella protothecoides x Auxenochlorella symbiontica]